MSMRTEDPELEELPHTQMDKYQRWNHLVGATGPYVQVMHAGIKRWGRMRYEDDGFVYDGRKKTPVGRYLRVERIGGHGEVALRVGRLDDVHEIEKIRWRNLLRIKNVIVPIVQSRSKEVAKYARSGGRRGCFTGWYDGLLYKVEHRKETGSISYEEVERKKAKNPLDAMARDYTPAEADQLVKRFVEISDRLHKAWMFNGRLSCVLLKALTKRLGPEGDREQGEHLGLTEVVINGRTYMVYIGHRGYFHNMDEVTRCWPCPMNKRIDLDNDALIRGLARYYNSTSDARKRGCVHLE